MRKTILGLLGFLVVALPQIAGTQEPEGDPFRAPSNTRPNFFVDTLKVVTRV